MINDKLKEMGLEDLHSSYGGIIHTLLYNDEMTMKDLAKEIKRDASTVTVLVRNLEKKGYVTKVENVKDTRSKLISLTPKSKELWGMITEISYDVNSTLFDGFTEEELAQLVDYLNRIIDNANENN